MVDAGIDELRQRVELLAAIDQPELTSKATQLLDALIEYTQHAGD